MRPRVLASLCFLAALACTARDGSSSSSGSDESSNSEGAADASPEADLAAPLGDCELVRQWREGCCELPSPCPTILRACSDDSCDEPMIAEPAEVACVYAALTAGEDIRFRVAAAPELPFDSTYTEYWRVGAELLAHRGGVFDLSSFDSWRRCTLADPAVLSECAAVQDPIGARACVDRFCDDEGPSTPLGDCDIDDFGDACAVAVGLECPTSG